MKKSIKNSYVYKIILTLVILVSFFATSISAMFLLYYYDSGLLTNTEETIKGYMDSLGEYYEVRAFEEFRSPTGRFDDKNINFHYIIIEGDDIENSVADFRQGKKRAVAGNVASIPEDAVVSKVKQDIGDSTGFAYSDYSGWILVPHKLGGDIQNDGLSKSHLIEKYGLSKDEHTVYFLSEGIWYPLSDEDEPKVHVSGVRSNSTERCEEWYDLDALNLTWFKDTYDVDEKTIDLVYEFGYNDEGTFEVDRDLMETVDPGAALPENNDKKGDDQKTAGKKEPSVVIGDECCLDSELGSFLTTVEDPSVKSYVMMYYVGQKEGEHLDSYVADINGGYALNTDYKDYYVQQTGELLKIVSYRNAFIAFIVAGMILMVLCGILLIVSAGHHSTPHPKSKEENYILAADGSGVIERRGFDHIPMDLYLIIELMVLGTVLAVFDNVGRWWMIFLYLPVAAVLSLPFVISLAVNIKVGGMWKKTLVYRAFRGLGILVSKLREMMKKDEGVKGLKRRAWITYAVLFILHLFAFLIMSGNSYSDDINVPLGIVFLAAWGFIAWRLMKWLSSLSAVVQGAEAVAGGDMSYTINTAGMPMDLSLLSDNINHIRAGLDAAVEERMKSDRMQTELITNVSHDIRTPLTSIVNYVDLLSKEELESEKAREYVDVLSRQAQRLKKLISDLIDASKATSGAIKLEMEKINASVLLTQAVGEYSEKLSERNINMVVESPESDIYINADPQRLWRVFDNLLNNSVKYGQEGTRAYVDVTEAGEDGMTSIIFRNISAAPLHISGEELMQRFVRGDVSRSSEGSGLGLSIARSLTELMGGRFELSVDGDLFKVILRFPVVEKNQI